MSGDEKTTSAFAGALLPPFFAVVAVTAILLALFVWVGPEESDTDVLSAGRPTPTSPPAASPTETPPASSPPVSSPAPETSPPPSSEKPDPDRPEVVVLNQSGGSGLAGRVADRVLEAGWEVNKVGSFNGTVRTTTVYHPSGLRSAARDLARDLPGDPRVLERFSNLSATRLTIVLTGDYGS